MPKLSYVWFLLVAFGRKHIYIRERHKIEKGDFMQKTVVLISHSIKEKEEEKKWAL